MGCYIDNVIDLLVPEIEHIFKTWSNGEIVEFVTNLSQEIEEEAFTQLINGQLLLDIDSTTKKFI